MVEHRYTLDDLELGCLEKLVNIPSYNVEGEVRKMDLIESLLQKADVRFTSLSLGDSADGHPSRRVLIAEKGDEGAAFTIMFYAHIDTVKPPDEWLHPQFERKDGKIYGNGSWDMQYGVQQMVSLAHTANVPRGMKVRFIFCPDEEKTSRGVKKLLSWPLMQETDLVISAEIGGPLPLRQKDEPMRFITARRGVLKMEGQIWSEKRGHGTGGGISAIDEYAEANVRIRRHARRFAREQGGTHPLLGTDELRTTSIEARRSKYQNVKRRVTFGTNVHFVPTKKPRSLEEIFRIYQLGFERVAKMRKWQEQNVRYTLTRVDPSIEESYLPYDQDNDHELFLPVRRAVREVCHPSIEPVEAPGMAWADQNKIVEAGYPCICVPADGENCHDTGEWVLEEDIGKIREVFRYCIERAFLPFLQKKAKSE